jgi:hypothetical protein
MDVFARYRTFGMTNQSRDGYLGEAKIVCDAREAAALNALATKATTPRTPTARITNAVHGTFGLRQF